MLADALLGVIGWDCASCSPSGAAANELRTCGERIDFGLLLRFSVLGVDEIEEESSGIELKRDAKDHRRESLFALTSEIFGLGGGDGRGCVNGDSKPDVDGRGEEADELARSTWVGKGKEKGNLYSPMNLPSN